MMREVLGRRFKRLMNEAPRPMPGAPPTPAQVLAMAPADAGAPIDIGDGDNDSPWPDLVIIDGGRASAKISASNSNSLRWDELSASLRASASRALASA